MSRLNRFDRQNPFDYLITAQGNISELFTFMKDNSINYNGSDFYQRKDWDIKITRRVNTSTVSASMDIETGASFNKSFNKSYDTPNE